MRLLFIGPVLTASGYGVHSRQLLRALVDTGCYDVAVEATKWGDTPTLSGPEFDWIRGLTGRPSENPDVAIQVTIASEFKRRAPLMVGVTAGIEVDRVSPGWIARCNEEVDLVVVPSQHSLAAFSVEYQSDDGAKLRLQKPIFVIPEGVDTDVYRPGVGTFDGDLPPKCFVFTGLGLDKLNGHDRKNVSQLVEYFCRTFAGSEEVGLVLKTSIVNYSAIDHSATVQRISEIRRAVGCGPLPKISLIHGRLTDAQMAGLYCDPRVIAAVSLTHGEGFGLPLIEAAACDLPVMATSWSGHLDFLSKEGKRLFVPFEHDLQEIPAECVWNGVLDAGTRWATVREPDVTAKLQKMVLSSTTPRKWAVELGQHVRDRFNLAVTGAAFCDLIARAIDSYRQSAPRSRAEFVRESRARVKAQGPSMVYTMPMSAGDVFLSTGVISSLRRKHPGYRVCLATSSKYFEIVKGLKTSDDTELIDELIEWQPWMQDVSILEDIFDEVYTPNLAVQMTHSNWVHRGHGRKLIDEFAVQCGVEADDPILPRFGSGALAPDRLWVAIHSGGQKSARRYSRWTEVVKNLQDNGVGVVQVGAADDIDVGKVDLDYRGKTNHVGLLSVLCNCRALLGIDSYPMHVANSLGLKIVALFGSSYPGSTGPKKLPVLNSIQQEYLESGKFDRDDLDLDRREADEAVRLRLIETPDRNGCERACYKDACAVDADNPCINNITAERIFLEVMDVMKPGCAVSFKEYRPKVAGYTHVLNPIKHGYPYVESIRSMLGFCDEVVVVDGGSTDGSYEKLQELESLNKDKLKLIRNLWDPDEPGMDGMQKAFGRAMVSPNIDFLWQQDADEIVHEDDYDKVRDICRRFPSDVDVIHLPVIELWGDARHCRTDRHSWKWRLSRNNFRVTHGIALQARLMDEKTGRIYAKRGMSDGCEMIDVVTGQHLPHRGFYSKELEELRGKDPVAYGRQMNDIFDKLPSVWHYSWADLPRKIRNFRDFWDNQWQTLYQCAPSPRFPDVVSEDDVLRKAEELRHRGGEHGPAAVFELRREQPKVMKDFP